MKRFSVQVPLVGYADMEILATDEYQARELALQYGARFRVELDDYKRKVDGATIDYHMVEELNAMDCIASGDVSHAPLNRIETEEVVE